MLKMNVQHTLTLNTYRVYNKAIMVCVLLRRLGDELCYGPHGESMAAPAQHCRLILPSHTAGLQLTIWHNVYPAQSTCTPDLLGVWC